MITVTEKSVKQLKQENLDFIMDREFTRRLSDKQFLSLLNRVVKYSILEAQNVETVSLEIDEDHYVEGVYRSYFAMLEGFKTGFSVYCNYCGAELELKNGMTAESFDITLSRSEIKCSCGYSLSIDKNNLVTVHEPDDVEDLFILVSN